jgi:hypothetical protein
VAFLALLGTCVCLLLDRYHRKCEAVSI